MARHALILADLGRTAEARELALRAWKRYPDSDHARGLVVRILWQCGEFDLASRVVVGTGGMLAGEVWRDELGPYFRTSIAPDMALVLRAVGPIAEAGYPACAGLLSLSYVLDEAGDPGTAYAIESAIQAEGQDQYILLLGCYRYMERWKGHDEAVAWLANRIAPFDPSARDMFLNYCFGEGMDDMLWDFELPKVPARDLEFLWVLRAAGTLRSPVPHPDREHALRKHFGAKNADHYRVLGRVILGMEPEAVGLALCTNPHATSEVYYYLGLKGQWAGRIRDAAALERQRKAPPSVPPRA